MADEPQDELQRNEAGDYLCPECGEPFKGAISLGKHRASKHGVPGKNTAAAKKRSPAASSKRQANVKKALLDMVNLSEALRGRERGGDLPEHLAEVIRNDADALAAVVASVADRLNPVAWAVDHVLVFAAPVTGCSGVIRWLLRAWRRQLETRGQEAVEPLIPEDELEAPWRGEQPAAVDVG